MVIKDRLQLGRKRGLEPDDQAGMREIVKSGIKRMKEWQEEKVEEVKE